MTTATLTEEQIVALNQYGHRFTPVSAMTTNDLVAEEIKIGTFLAGATTPDGRVYVTAVEGRLEQIRAELSRRNA